MDIADDCVYMTHLHYTVVVHQPQCYITKERYNTNDAVASDTNKIYNINELSLKL